jgi:hypothetical protein
VADLAFCDGCYCADQPGTTELWVVVDELDELHQLSSKSFATFKFEEFAGLELVFAKNFAAEK